MIAAHFILIDAPGLKAAIWRPLVKCGQQSLEVFCVGLYLSLIGYFFCKRSAMEFLLNSSPASAASPSVAYYRSWSKQIEKSVHAHPGRPAAEVPGVPIGEPAKQSNGTVAVVA